MPLIEQIDQRKSNSKVFIDAANPEQHLFVASIGQIHYESIPGSGNFDSEVNATPQRINNTSFNGWGVTENDFHYRIGRSKTGVLGNADGVVGFGGRKGANWFYFRLARLGYLLAPLNGTPSLATDFTPIGGAPTYDRANLKNTINTVPFGGATLNIESVAEWRNLWTPGSGEIYARWKVSGGRLKEEIVIDAAARAWITANAVPTTPAKRTFFSLVFQVGMSNIPKRVVKGAAKAVDADFDDKDGPIALKTASDELLAFMPIDYVIVKSSVDTGRIGTDGSPIFEEVSTRLELRKRFWKDADGNTYLIVGALASDVAALPAGDLIFDPTFAGYVATGTDDAAINDAAYSDTALVIQVGGVSPSPLTNYGEGWRFPNVTVPQNAVVSSAYIGLIKAGASWSNINFRWAVVDEDNTATFSSGSPPGSRPIVSTIAVESLNLSRADVTPYYFPDDSGVRATFGSAFQTVFARSGWVSGNALAVVCQSAQDPSADLNYSREGYYTYDAATAAAALLTIVYTTPGGSVTISPDGGATVQQAGSPVISTVAITVSPDGGGSVQQAGNPVVSAVAITISPDGGATVQQAGSPVISTVAITISPASGGTLQQAGDPVVSEATFYTLPPSGVSEQTSGAVTVTLTPITISPDGGSSLQSGGDPIVSAISGAVLYPDSGASLQSGGDPIISLLPAMIYVAAGASTEASGSPTINETPDPILYPDSGATLQTGGVPAVLLIPQIIQPSSESSLQSGGNPIISQVNWVINPPSGTSVQAGGAPMIIGALPPGLTLDPVTGVISGTPLAAGTFVFTIIVVDSSTPYATTSHQYTITVV